MFMNLMMNIRHHIFIYINFKDVMTYAHIINIIMIIYLNILLHIQIILLLQHLYVLIQILKNIKNILVS